MNVQHVSAFNINTSLTKKNVTPHYNVCPSPFFLAVSFSSHHVAANSAHVTPEPASVPDVEDDDADPNYARINHFRQQPSPRTFVSRTPSPAAPVVAAAMANHPQVSADELDGLYAKVVKQRPPPAQQQADK